MAASRDPADAHPLAAYAPGAGPDRYVAFARDVFALRLAHTQRRILRSMAENQRTLVVSGNGVGKSYGVAAGIGAFLFGNPDSTVNLTSGTYSVLSDTIWKPLKNLHRRARDAGHPLPHRALENPPRLKTDADDEWFFKAISPTYPKNLEGRHNERMLSVIEEADSPDITEAHITSAGSTLTSDADRLVVIANPPDDGVGPVADLMGRPDWHTIQFSSFDSHNVLVDAGELDAPKIPGLVSLDKLKEDYETWNDRDWPGFEAAQERHQGMDARWAKRRLGIIPPAGAQVHRPFYASDVKAAFRPRRAGVAIRDQPTAAPVALALDVARKGGDENVLSGVFPTDDGTREVRIIDAWTGLDHNENESRVRGHLNDEWVARLAVDANGEGSGLADRIETFYPPLERFDAGRVARQGQQYRDAWSEALAAFGDLLNSGTVIADRELREQALAAARAVEFEERYLKSRDAAVFQASPKDAIKDVLGHSPDRLDAAAMAAWAASDATVPESSSPSFETRSGVQTSSGSRRTTRSGSGSAATRHTR